MHQGDRHVLAETDSDLVLHDASNDEYRSNIQVQVQTWLNTYPTTVNIHRPYADTREADAAIQ